MSNAVRKIGPWREARALLGAAPMRFKAVTERAVRQEAQLLRKAIVQGITRQAPGGDAFTPLAPLTLATRRLTGFRGTKALIRHADLRNSVVVKHLPGATAFVGVPRTATGSDGKELVKIAEVHEFGSDPIVIPLTDAMRRFLGVLLDESGERNNRGTARVVVTQIPPRPFLRPAFREWSKGVQARFLARIAAGMGIMGGRR